jgi:SNF2 family DNA or RNA helicase
MFTLGKFIGIGDTLLAHDKTLVRRFRTDVEFLRDVMAILCLRRTKEMSFINLNLPPKEEELIRIEFSQAEGIMYDKLLFVLTSLTPHYLPFPQRTSPCS